MGRNRYSLSPRRIIVSGTPSKDCHVFFTEGKGVLRFMATCSIHPQWKPIPCPQFLEVNSQYSHVLKLMQTYMSECPVQTFQAITLNQFRAVKITNFFVFHIRDMSVSPSVSPSTSPSTLSSASSSVSSSTSPPVSSPHASPHASLPEIDLLCHESLVLPPSPMLLPESASFQLESPCAESISCPQTIFEFMQLLNISSPPTFPKTIEPTNKKTEKRKLEFPVELCKRARNTVV